MLDTSCYGFGHSSRVSTYIVKEKDMNRSEHAAIQPQDKTIKMVTDARAKDRISRAYTDLTNAELELRRITARHRDADRQLLYLINKYHKRDLISLKKEAIEEYITAPEVDDD